MLATNVMTQPEPMSWRAGVMSRMASADDSLRRALLAGDEAAFERFVAARYPALLRIASCAHEPAESTTLVQHAIRDFCAALDASEPAGLSLDAQLFQCLVQRMRKRAHEIGADDPFAPGDIAAPSVASDRFRGNGHRWSGGWVEPPRPFAIESAVPATLAEVQRALAAALDRLPPRQRVVTTLRDVQGLSSTEICTLMDMTHVALRDALHRGRSALRAALESHLMPKVQQREHTP